MVVVHKEFRLLTDNSEKESGQIKQYNAYELGVAQ